MQGWPAWMGWGGPVGVLWMLGLLALIVVAAIALARTLLPDPRDGHGRDETPDDAQSVLRLRFANGEIDETEFLNRRAALEHEARTMSTHHPSPTPGGPR
jgi:uncharacterized membrane protein